MWIGQHFICPPGGEGYPQGKLASFGLMLIDTDGNCFVEVDVFDDAFGTQELLIRLENDDVLQAFFTVQ